MFSTVSVYEPRVWGWQLITKVDVPSMLSDADKIKAARNLLDSRGFILCSRYKLKVRA